MRRCALRLLTLSLGYPHAHLRTCGMSLLFAGCTLRYKKMEYLMSHMRRHTGDKPFQCSWPGCNWRFCRSDELLRHARMHNGDRPFSCQLCGKSFSRSDHLKKHGRTHRGSGPFYPRKSRRYPHPLPQPPRLLSPELELGQTAASLSLTAASLEVRAVSCARIVGRALAITTPNHDGFGSPPPASFQAHVPSRSKMWRTMRGITAPTRRPNRESSPAAQKQYVGWFFILFDVF
jgi:hypothetical protein